MQIAAEHSEAVREGAGVGVKEGLFLDGIALHSGNVAPGNVERTTMVKTNFANAGLAFWNRATVSTGVATHSIAVELFPKCGVGFADAVVRGKNILQSGHVYILRLVDWLCLVLTLAPWNCDSEKRRGEPRLYKEFSYEL